MAVPLNDRALQVWCRTFYRGALPSPGAVGLSSAQLAELHGLMGLYDQALADWNDLPNRSISRTQRKSSTKGNLISLARQLYGVVKMFPDITSQQLVDLGVNLRKEASPRPKPDAAPFIWVKSVYGRQFHLEVRDAETGRRRKPFGCLGYTLFSYAGPGPTPADMKGWVCEGNLGTSSSIINLPTDLPAGTVVHFTARWYGTGGSVSAGCTPVVTQVGIEGVSVG